MPSIREQIFQASFAAPGSSMREHLASIKKNEVDFIISNDEELDLIEEELSFDLIDDELQLEIEEC